MRCELPRDPLVPSCQIRYAAQSAVLSGPCGAPILPPCPHDPALTVLYQPRRPQDTFLYRLVQENLETFLAKMHRYARLEADCQAAAGRRPNRRDTWIAPPREVFRRLIYRQGVLDGPAGWAFCLLSGLSEWVLAREHRRLRILRHRSPLTHPWARIPSHCCR